MCRGRSFFWGGLLFPEVLRVEEKPSNRQQSSSAQRKLRPRTSHGKQNSKYNALKTGIFAKVVLTTKPFNERRDDFDNLLERLRRSVGPHDHFEQLLVEGLALELLKLARTYQADAEVASLLFRNIREKLKGEDDDQEITDLLDEQAPSQYKFPAAELLMRYETSIWRQIDRMIERLQHWRRLHVSLPKIGSPTDGDV